LIFLRIVAAFLSETANHLASEHIKSKSMLILDDMETTRYDGLLNTCRFTDVPCLICGGEQTEIVASAADVGAQLRILEQFHLRRRRETQLADLADRTEFTQDYLTDVVECLTCGFIFRNPRPVISAVILAYVKDQYSECYLQSEFMSHKKWAQKKSSILARWLPVDRRPVVIEVGSFVGGFLAAGQGYGWNMLGVDPGRQVTEFCRARGLPVHCGTLTDVSIPDSSVDAVVIWNTFDQLPNPDANLAAARQILRKAGVLVVRVPNGSLYRIGVEIIKGKSVWQNAITTILAWNNLLAFPYLHGYSIFTLDQLLGRNGFRRCQVHPDTLLPLANQSTRIWARWEESMVKWGCRAVAAQRLWNIDQLAPWLDLYYERSEEIPDTPITGCEQESSSGRYGCNLRWNLFGAAQQDQSRITNSIAQASR
jgi:SAM-dependent methyltransferase